jgi:hypothetical protein
VSDGEGRGVGWGGGCQSTKNTPVTSNAAVERIYSEPRIFVVDDDSGLSAIGSVR